MSKKKLKRPAEEACDVRRKRQKWEDQNEGQVSKDIKRIRHFEETILLDYRLFLTQCDETIKGCRLALNYISCISDLYIGRASRECCSEGWFILFV